MKPTDQKYEHISSKQNGDCWRACLASILEVDIETFPRPKLDQYDGEGWIVYAAIVNEILKSMGWNYSCIGIDNIKQPYLSVWAKDTDGYVIAVGESSRGPVNHAVVWKDGIAHDPHASRSGINSITHFEFLTRLETQ